MIALRLPGPDDAAEIVDSLLKDAAILDAHAPALAARKRRLADAIGDALDRLPRPTHTPEGRP